MVSTPSPIQTILSAPELIPDQPLKWLAGFTAGKEFHLALKALFNIFIFDL